MAEISARMNQKFGLSQAGPTPFDATKIRNVARGMASSPMSGALAGTLSGTIGGATGTSPMAPFGGSASVPGFGGGPTDRLSALRPLIEKSAADTGIDADLLQALIQMESGGNPQAVSRNGAQGLTQLMPGTARSLGVTDPFDPAQSIQGGARYLGQMLRQFPSVEQALAAYNAGPGKVSRAGGIPINGETPEYVSKVMNAWQKMKRP